MFLHLGQITVEQIFIGRALTFEILLRQNPYIRLLVLPPACRPLLSSPVRVRSSFGPPRRSRVNPSHELARPLNDFEERAIRARNYDERERRKGRLQSREREQCVCVPYCQAAQIPHLIIVPHTLSSPAAASEGGVGFYGGRGREDGLRLCKRVGGRGEGRGGEREEKALYSQGHWERERVNSRGIFTLK